MRIWLLIYYGLKEKKKKKKKKFNEDENIDFFFPKVINILDCS